MARPDQLKVLPKLHLDGNNDHFIDRHEAAAHKIRLSHSGFIGELRNMIDEARNQVYWHWLQSAVRSMS